jgi:hypothetical protein
MKFKMTFLVEAADVGNLIGAVAEGSLIGITPVDAPPTRKKAKPKQGQWNAKTRVVIKAPAKLTHIGGNLLDVAKVLRQNNGQQCTYGEVLKLIEDIGEYKSSTSTSLRAQAKAKGWVQIAP